MKVKISDIVEAFELQGDEAKCYVNVETGAVVTVSDEYARMAEDKVDMDDLADWEQEMVREAEAVADGLGAIYVELPSQYERNEYSVMVEYIDELDNPAAAEDLAGAIRGKGAFRRFKDTARHWNLEKEWFKFRDDALAGCARAWCDENDIPFEEA